jgi:hypothetical protein
MFFYRAFIAAKEIGMLTVETLTYLDFPVATRLTALTWSSVVGHPLLTNYSYTINLHFMHLAAVQFIVKGGFILMRV